MASEAPKRMTSYRSTTHIPPLVERATALADPLTSSGSPTRAWPEVGRLLAVLAGHVRGGVIGEIGTGCGVGTAWMASTLAPDTQLITIELDAPRAELTRDLFGSVPNVRVLQGDWHEFLLRGPFDMLFVDGGGAKREEPEAILAALRPGGFVVLDDLWPARIEPPELRDQPDPVRALWLNEPRLAATEILTGPRMAVIIATRA